jgi:hypothetical protein
MTILLLAVLAPCFGYAELRDPTQPSYPLPTESAVSNSNEELIVSAIWISPKSRRVTLNGLSARQGDTLLNGVKVLRIRHNSVTVQQNGVIKTLLLIQRPYIKPANNKRRLLK